MVYVSGLVKPKLLDFIDPNRPLAKVTRELDWAEVVGLFPEATQEGLSAGKIWILASLIILSEITGLSESEVLSRWPENPYWQSFSGLAQFQWTAPVTQAECLNFRRHLTTERAASLAKIAKSIREAKHMDASRQSTPVEIGAESSPNDALALRRIHLTQPLPAQPYKAPPRPDFHSSIKQAYARGAAAIKNEETGGKDILGEPQSAARPDLEVTGDATAASAAGTPTKQGDAPLSQEPTPEATEPSADKVTLSKEPTPASPIFAQTYAPPKRTAATPTQQQSLPLEMESGTKSKLQPKGTPTFDSTTPIVLRAPVGEPVKMEVVATGAAPLQFQWEAWDESKGDSIPLEGCNTPSLEVALEPADAMLAFQCRVRNEICPEGVVSRTFFLKKVGATQKPVNSFGEKFDPRAGKANVNLGRV